MDEDMTLEEQGLVVIDESEPVSLDIQRQSMGLDKLMEMADMLSKSTIVPVSYQRRPENCFVALDMASRMGVSPMIVMQNLYVIQGKPSWSGSAIAAMIRTNPTLKDVQLNYVGEERTDSWGAYVSAVRVKDGKLIKGGTVTIGTAKKEGWFQKNGSKWQTMPEQMLGYRAYAWFGRLYTPETMMGLQSTDEVEDYVIQVQGTVVKNPYDR